MTKVAQQLCHGCTWFSCMFSCFQSPFLLIIRIIWGVLFLQAGVGKLMNLESTTEFIASLNIPYPQISTYLLAATETVGGLFLILGLYTRFAALCLSFAMGVALATAHKAATLAFFTNPAEFFAQPAFTFLFATLVLLLFGPGLFSIDAFCARKKCCKENGTCETKK